MSLTADVFPAHPSGWRTCPVTPTCWPNCLAPVAGRRLTYRNLSAGISFECLRKSKRWAFLIIT